jgi:hypothetical protein
MQLIALVPITRELFGNNNHNNQDLIKNFPGLLSFSPSELIPNDKKTQVNNPSKVATDSSEILLQDVQNLYTENKKWEHLPSHNDILKDNFEGKQKEELSVKPSDDVKILLKNLPCFWYVENRSTNERGLVPAKCFVYPRDRFKIIEEANL